MNELTAETLCINVLAALIGLSYPILLQIITSLDTKYGSVKLMKRFTKEPTYKWFTVSLIIMFVVMVYMPFAPLAPEDAPYIISHSARITALVVLFETFISLVFLVKVTLIYFNPVELQKRVSSKEEILLKDNNAFQVFLDLLKFSMRAENLQLFLNCNEVFGDIIGLQRKPVEERIKKRMDSEREESKPIDIVQTFSQQTYQAVDEITRLSIKIKSINPYIASPVNFITALFGAVGKSVMSRDSLGWLWRYSIRIAREGDDDWIKDYWIYAIQMAQYTMDQRVYNFSIPKNYRKEYETEQKRFIQQHYMLGAYIMSRSKIDLLKELTELRVSSFSEFLLIPDTLDKIIDYIKEVESNAQFPIYYQTTYPFFETRGVGDNEYIEGWFYKYSLFCLLKKVSETGANIDKIFECAFSSSAADTKAHDIIRRLRAVLYNNLVYFENLGFKRIALLDSIDKKLQDIENTIDEQKKKEISETIITEEEISKLRDKVTERVEECLRSFPSTEKIDKDSAVTLQDSTGIELSKETLWLFKEQFLAEQPSLIKSWFAKQVSTKYIAELYSPNKTYNIDFAEIRKALDKLEVTDSHIVIGSGGIDEHDDDRIRYSVFGSEATIYIFKDGNLIILNQTLEKDDVECAVEDGDPLFLKYDIKYRMSIPERLRFVKLRIVSSLYDGRRSQLGEIKALSEIL